MLIFHILPNKEFIFVQQQAATVLQALGQSQPAARLGESWLALCAPWPVWVQVIAAVIGATTTLIIMTTRAVGMRPSMMLKRTTLLQQRQQLLHWAAGWTLGVGALGTANRCSSTTHLVLRLGSSAGHPFRYIAICTYISLSLVVSFSYHTGSKAAIFTLTI